MKIRIDNLPDEGLDLSVDLAEPWAADAARASLDQDPESLHADLNIAKVGGYIRVTGQGQAALLRSCDRCGADLRLRIGGPVDLYYSPPPTDDIGDIVALSRDDLDVGFFDGVALDLADVVGEQLALWMPSRVACGDRRVDQVDPEHPCELPAGVLPAGSVHDKDQTDEPSKVSPFAGLRLPE